MTKFINLMSYKQIVGVGTYCSKSESIPLSRGNRVNLKYKSGGKVKQEFEIKWRAIRGEFVTTFCSKIPIRIMYCNISKRDLGTIHLFYSVNSFMLLDCE